MVGTPITSTARPVPGRGALGADRTAGVGRGDAAPGRSELADRLATLMPGLRVMFSSGYTDDAVGSEEICRGGVTAADRPAAHAWSAARRVLSAGANQRALRGLSAVTCPQIA